MKFDCIIGKQKSQFETINEKGIWNTKKIMINLVIIGAGSIASKDFENKNDKLILSHAHAAYIHKNINLIGIVDIDTIKANKAADKWNTNAYSDLCQIQKKIDIAIVAVNTENHYKILNDIINNHREIDLVLCEKPFCNNLEEAREMHKIYKKHNIKLLVNYSRHFLPVYQELAKQFHNNEFGEIYHCTLKYTRGLKREASHFIDLCNWWFGQFIIGNYGIVEYPFTYINDFSENDKTCAVYLKYEKCPDVFLCPVDGRKTSIFEIDIIASKARIRLIDNGAKIEYYYTKPESIWGSYNCIHSIPDKIIDTDIYRHPYYTLDYCVNILTNKTEPICTSEDAIKIHEIYNKLGV